MNFHMLIEVFKLFETYIVVNSAIWNRFNNPIIRNIIIRILNCEVESAQNIEEKRHHIAIRYDIANRCDLFSIPKLDCFRSSDSF